MPVVQCPCGARYKVPAEAAGRKARCKKCRITFRVPVPPVPIPLAGESAPGGGSGPDTAEPAAETASGTMFDRADASPAYDPKTTTHVPEFGRIRPRTGFWSDVGWTLVFFISPHSMVMFLIVWLLSVVASFVGCFGLVIELMVAGWYIGVIAETASGEDDLPQFSIAGGVWEDMIWPGLQYSLTWILLLAPATLYSMFMIASLQSSGLLDPTQLDPFNMIASAGASAAPLILLVALAVILWPIALMCVSLGGLSSLVRMDLIIMAVGRTLLPYLAIVILVGAASFLPGWIMHAAGASLVGGPAAGGIGGLVKSTLAFVMIAAAVDVYFSIIVMRLIGLYYRHFKQRFPWDWE